MPRLVAADAPSSFPVPAKLAAKEKGMRSVIVLQNGTELGIMQLNTAG